MDAGTIADYEQGVVFYLVREEEVPRATAIAALRGLASMFAAPEGGLPRFVVRAGFREGAEEGTYWVGLNSMACGGPFELLLRTQGAAVVRKPVLPDGSQPVLRPLLPELAEEAAAQNGYVDDELQGAEEVAEVRAERVRRRVNFPAWGSRLRGLRRRRGGGA